MFNHIRPFKEVLGAVEPIFARNRDFLQNQSFTDRNRRVVFSPHKSGLVCNYRIGTRTERIYLKFNRIIRLVNNFL